MTVSFFISRFCQVVFVVCLCVYTARKQALSCLYSQVVARKSDKFTSVSWEANSSAQIFFLFTDIYFDLVKPKKKKRALSRCRTDTVDE